MMNPACLYHILAVPIKTIDDKSLCCSGYEAVYCIMHTRIDIDIRQTYRAIERYININGEIQKE